MVLHPLSLFTALCLFATAPTTAQVADEGILVIRRNGVEIGRETFRVRPARPGRPVGDSLVSNARYPATRPAVELHAALERSREAGFNLLLDRLAAEGASQVYVAGEHGRVTVRAVALGSETAREYPGSDRVVMLDDSVFALYLAAGAAATEAGEKVSAIFPRTGRRVTFTTRRDTTPADRTLVAIQMTGDLTGTLYLDQAGRFAKLELPGSGTEVVRVRN